ncbi:MAG: C2 family cysteine protease [Saprospiraceae bacterium]|nr:C2 family cysteine protease [Saprospiraceae bacterium]
MPLNQEEIRELEAEIASLKSTLQRYSYLFEADDDANDEDLERLIELVDNIQDIQEELAELKAEELSPNPRLLERHILEGHEDHDHTDPDQQNHNHTGKIVDLTKDTERMVTLFKTGKDPYDDSDDDNSVSHNDVDQGSIGDCYFMAAVGAVAKANPQAIKNLISGPDSDGNYKVKLYVNKNNTQLFSWRSYEMVTITPEFLVNSSGKPIYAGLGDGELWVMLLEKAYAILRGKAKWFKPANDYAGIEGGSGEEVIEVLTGQEADRFSISSLTDEVLIEKITDALDNKKPITTSTPSEYTEAQKSDMATRGVSLYASHVYYILAIDSDEITLRNPHNNSTATGRTFKLSMENYKKFFTALSRQQ